MFFAFVLVIAGLFTSHSCAGSGLQGNERLLVVLHYFTELLALWLLRSCITLLNYLLCGL